MSFPGGMSRGKHQILKAGAKGKIEDFFARDPPLLIHDLGSRASKIASDYDNWHSSQCEKLGSYLRERGCLGSPRNTQEVVAAKLMNTFMHQLMKYERFRCLWDQLHLPLDARVFSALRRWKSPTARLIVEKLGERTTYAITFDDYRFTQEALWDLIAELNARPGATVKIGSRIELNFLWL